MVLQKYRMQIVMGFFVSLSFSFVCPQYTYAGEEPDETIIVYGTRPKTQYDGNGNGGNGINLQEVMDGLMQDTGEGLYTDGEEESDQEQREAQACMNGCESEYNQAVEECGEQTRDLFVQLGREWEADPSIDHSDGDIYWNMVAVPHAEVLDNCKSMAEEQFQECLIECDLIEVLSPMNETKDLNS